MVVLYHESESDRLEKELMEYNHFVALCDEDSGADIRRVKNYKVVLLLKGKGIGYYEVTFYDGSTRDVSTITRNLIDSYADKDNSESFIRRDHPDDLWKGKF